MQGKKNQHIYAPKATSHVSTAQFSKEDNRGWRIPLLNKRQGKRDINGEQEGNSLQLGQPPGTQLFSHKLNREQNHTGYNCCKSFAWVHYVQVLLIFCM